MTAISLFWDTNMAIVTSCENTLLRASYDTNSDSLIDKLGWRKLDEQRLIN